VASVFFTRESTIFRDRLLEGVPKGGDEKSPQSRKNTDTSDVCVKQTIVIEAHENVTADDFAQLCSIFFNPFVDPYSFLTISPYSSLPF
jgi:hypothetical protein